MNVKVGCGYHLTPRCGSVVVEHPSGGVGKWCFLIDYITQKSLFNVCNNHLRPSCGSVVVKHPSEGGGLFYCLH